MTTKSEIRQAILTKRQALSPTELERRSLRVLDAFLAAASKLLPRDYASVAFYVPVRGEVDARAFYEYFRALGKQCLFPRVDATRNLEFHEVKEWSELQPGAFGIPEPSAASQVMQPDLVFVPGVAFSPDGHRIGFGAGFYDRTFSAWEESGMRRRVLLVGLAHEFQIVDRIPNEAHDHPLDHVITENRIYSREAA